MKLGRSSTLQSRVGKRVLALVLVAALLPLGVLVVLLESEVRELLIDQGNRRVAAAAKTYAVGVFDRLLVARETAKYAEHPATGPAAPLAGRYFSALVLARPGAQSRVLIGAPDPELVQWAATATLAGLKTPSLLHRAGDGRIFMATRGMDPAAVLAGALNPAFLWGEEDEVPAGMTPCVIGADKVEPLFCPSGLHGGLLASMDLGRGQAKLAKVVRRGDGKTFRGIMWPMFMQNEFGLGDWYFTVLAEEGELFGTLHAFWRAFILVVALALLMSFWLSMRQIDGILTPLNQLTARTRAIAAREFDRRIDVASGDEFEELGAALNTMSDELGRQFELADTYAYIDRQILARGELRNVLAEALDRLSRLCSSPRIAALIFDREAADSVLALALPPQDAGPQQAERVELDDASRAAIGAVRDAVVVAADAVPPCLAAMLPGVQRRTLLQPILWGDFACGILALEAPEGRDFDAGERRFIAGFADRIAVAASANWRDAKLFFQAHHDALTRLPNRLLFNDRLQREITRGDREEVRMAVLFVDLDHFKTVNDTQGHVAGDELLCVAAERIRHAVRESDTVARYGGDEFAVLLAGLHDHQNALRVAEKIIGALSVPFSVAGQDSFLSASVGISVYPHDGLDAETLLRNADLAMYRAKAAGRRQCLFFEERMNAEAVARFALDRELHHAVARREFELHFQPQISSATGKVVAAEALIRWHHPARGLVAPGYFIPAAEASGIILDIGRLALEEACVKLRRWNADGLILDRLSINVSARQLARHDFIDLVQAGIAGDGKPLSIELEITESVLLEDTAQLVSGLTRLAEMGCSIALDDFGTGFSSLSYLKRLPVHCVKIDREFVMDLDRGVESHAFVEAIVKMSHALGKRVVAEGVETASQAAILRGLGCDYLQGYYFSRPVPEAAFVAFAREFEADFATLPAPAGP